MMGVTVPPPAEAGSSQPNVGQSQRAMMMMVPNAAQPGVAQPATTTGQPAAAAEPAPVTRSTRTHTQSKAV